MPKKVSTSKTAKPPRKAPTVIEIPSGDPVADWTVPQLRAYATGRDIDLGKLRVKAQILEAIVAAIEPSPAADPVTVLDATNRSIAKAVEGGILDSDLAAAPIAALRVLAQRIDDADTLADFLAIYATDNNLRPPSQDNVSIPTFLKYCEALGLTVVVAKAAPAKGGVSGGQQDKPKSKLVGLRSEYAGT